MERNNFTTYYRVFKNDTAVTAVSTNDFIPLPVRIIKAGTNSGPPVDVLCSIPAHYTLPADDIMFYGYTSKIKAMEMAKAGAMKYIDVMIKDVERGINKLKEYRAEHYNDLNINLLDVNIRRLEHEMNIK